MYIPPDRLFTTGLKLNSNFFVQGGSEPGDVIFSVLSTIWSWIVVILPTLSRIFEQPTEWTVKAFYAACDFLHAHPHSIYLISLSIFFGPIIVLLPLLLIYEIGVLLLFNLSFVSHGSLPGAVEDQYDSLHEHFMESREKLFASVEAATATFNTWTTNHLSLLITRVVAGTLGLYVLYAIWSEVW